MMAANTTMDSSQNDTDRSYAQLLSEKMGEMAYTKFYEDYKSTIAIVLFLVTLTRYYIWTRKKSSAHSIPGPLCLPLIGSVLSIGTQPHLSLTLMQKKYGDVFKVNIGDVPVLVLSGLNTVKKALVNQGEVFSGRPSLYTFRFLCEGKTMCFNSYSETWKIHRRLAERALKIVTKDTPFMDAIVQREATNLKDTFLSRKGTCFDPTNDLLWTVAHVKYSLCYGDSRQAGSDFEGIIKHSLKVVSSHNDWKGSVINFFPWTRHVFKTHFREITKNCHSCLNLSTRKETEHLHTYQKGQVRDALDALIEQGIETSTPLAQERVLHTVQEYICAGLEITYCSLSWALLYMVKYPCVQKRLQAELDHVVGSRLATVGDRQQMPYMQAFVMEVLRHSSVIPFALPHSTTETTELDGMVVPKDTFVLVNLFSICHDSSLWEKPEEFNPSRFLTADQSVVDTSVAERFISFGVGKRKCVGEQLSRNEIFLFVATILQSCTVVGDPSVGDYTLEAESAGLILKPRPFKVGFEERLQCATS